MGEILIDKSPSTSDSLKQFREWKHKIKGSDPVVIAAGDRGSDIIIVGSDGTVMRLGNFKVGYAGEGPRGLSSVLSELNLPFDFEKDIVRAGSLKGCSVAIHVFDRSGPTHTCTD